MRSYVRESCDNLAGVQLVRSLSTWFSSFIYSFSSISVPSNVYFTFFKSLFKLDHVKPNTNNFKIIGKMWEINTNQCYELMYLIFISYHFCLAPLFTWFFYMLSRVIIQLNNNIKSKFIFILCLVPNNILVNSSFLVFIFIISFYSF